MPADILRRNKALEKTATKYRGKPLDWVQYDCVRLVRSHLVAMGHKPPKLPSYRSPTGALRALKKTGHDSLESLFDALLPRIAPAEALPGDIVLIAGEPPFDCAGVWTGRKMLSWHQHSDEAVVMTVFEFKGAWRA